MRDQNESVGIAVKIVFEPVAGFQVEVVGGLVEQQQVGLCQQQLGQRNAHLPAAGELSVRRSPVGLGEAEAGEHGAHLRLQRVAVAGAEFGLRCAG